MFLFAGLFSEVTTQRNVKNNYLNTRIFKEIYGEVPSPVGTRYCGDIGFLLDLHRDIDRLRIEIKVTSLYDICFQHHNDVVAIT